MQEFSWVISNVTALLDEKQFSRAAECLYEFTWSELADWYLEMNKIYTARGIDRENKSQRDEVLLYVLSNLLILWHPFIPFCTEVIWKELSPEP